MLSLRNRAGRRLREPFGKAGLTVAVIALVFAMLGGAYAAGALSGKQKKEVEKIAKKYAGKPGAAGANGTNGKDGANGEKGAQGDKGEKGNTGTSVVTGNATEAECGKPLGTTVQVSGEPATKKKICNGKEGSPWTDGGTLPGGSTETGAWSYGKTATEGAINVTVGFAIPLSSAADAHLILANGKEIVLNETTFEVEEVTPTNCGTAVGGSAEEPKAAAGSFCMYVAQQSGTLTLGTTPGEISESNVGFKSPGSQFTSSFGGPHVTGNTGAHLSIQLFSGSSEGWGTWAVTG